MVGYPEVVGHSNPMFNNKKWTFYTHSQWDAKTSCLCPCAHSHSFGLWPLVSQFGSTNHKLTESRSQRISIKITVIFEESRYKWAWVGVVWGGGKNQSPSEGPKTCFVFWNFETQWASKPGCECLHLDKSQCFSVITTTEYMVRGSCAWAQVLVPGCQCLGVSTTYD